VSGGQPLGRFPPAQRVRKRSEFQRIQSAGRRVPTAHFTLLVQARPTADSARLGITVTRRVGNAVVRSRAKRLVREAFRATRALWAPDIDLVVIVKRPPASLGEVVAEWQAAARQISRRTREARKDVERRNSGLAIQT
jgi:ribonuclease P protein component